MSMKAVVLAAGRGSRLGDADDPKPLWEIAPGVGILQRQVRLLQALDIDVCVVVGYKQALVRERLGGEGVTFVENSWPDLSQSGSAHSFQFAARSAFQPLGGEEPCLMMDADIVYETGVLETIVRRAQGTTILVSPHVSADTEEVRVYGAGGRPRLLGKNLGPPQTDGMELMGEATGIVRFDPADHERVRELVDAINPDEEHEWIAQSLMNEDRIGAVHFRDELLFMEADFAEDFDRVRNEIYPEILRREGA
ncbi:MAG: phosphocholine cytidylyltransferase family protein [Planctomycetota bacterium]|jgi:choline kinase